jgi:cation diffusion facilitator family transporter
MSSDSKKAIYAALFGNLAIAITKLIATSITGSSAMLSESIHSIVDTGNEIFLLLGLRLSKKRADIEHPYGHGREVYFWSLIVALAIFALGGGVSVYEGINHILHPHVITDPFWNYVVLAFAFVFEGISWLFGWRAFRASKGKQGIIEAIQNSKDPSTFIVTFEDSGALLGLVIAFLGVFLGHSLNNPYLDGAASVLIGLMLSTMSVFLAYETKGLLIGEGYPRETLQALRKLIAKDPGVEKVNRVLTMFLGPDEVMLTVELQFNRKLSFAEVRKSIARVKQMVRERHPEIKRIYFAAEAIEGEHGEREEEVEHSSPL